MLRMSKNVRGTNASFIADNPNAYYVLGFDFYYYAVIEAHGILINAKL